MPVATAYESRVESSVAALRALSASVLDDLTDDVGGVGWWQGQVDFRRRVVLSEYLIDSVNGAAEALRDAALAAQDHREYLYADDQWLLGQWRAVGQDPRSTNENFIAAMQRGPAEERRDRRIEAAATHALAHAMHTLDCLAAAVLIVAAIPEGVRQAKWGAVQGLATKALNRSTGERFEPLGSPGRDLQDALLASLLRWPEHGPSDWLRWLTATRNTRIHRAARVHWTFLHGDKSKNPEGMLRPFPPHPDLTDIEILARHGGDGTQGLAPLRLNRRSTDIVDGIVGSMDGFVYTVAQALQVCWDSRRKNPSMLIQRGAQWQDLERVVDLHFEGYGEPAEQIGDQLHVSPDLARRLASAHVMEDGRHRWDQSESD